MHTHLNFTFILALYLSTLVIEQQYKVMFVTTTA